MTNRTLTRVFWIISVLAWTAVLVRVLLIADKCQWDFDVYYYAAWVHSIGLNPYDTAQLNELAGGLIPEVRRFQYLPVSLLFFKPFTYLSLSHAKYVFFLLKFGLLIYLFILWQCKILENRSDPFFALFCLLAFNATIFLDMRAGNVSIIEQAAVWSALYAFIRGKLALFCVLLSAASIFKLTPLLLAGLLLFDRGRSKNGPFLLLVSAICTICLVSWYIVPDWFSQFYVYASKEAEGDRFINIINPSTFSLVRFLSLNLFDATGISVPDILQWCLYLAIVVPVIVLSYMGFQKLDMSNLEQRKTAACLTCLVYAVVLPRFLDYQWILLLVPAYLMMLRVDFVKAYPVVFIFSLLSAEHQTLPGSAFLFRVFWNYFPLVLAFALGFMYLQMIERDFIAQSASERKNGSESATPGSNA